MDAVLPPGPTHVNRIRFPSLDQMGRDAPRSSVRRFEVPSPRVVTHTSPPPAHCGTATLAPSGEMRGGSPSYGPGLPTVPSARPERSNNPSSVLDTVALT